jgi:hypothetical protein
MQDTTYYLSHARATSPETARLADGVGLIALGALLVAALILRSIHRRRAALAKRAAAIGDERLRPGPTVLAGRIADDGEGAAFTVEVEQVGREREQRGGWAHRWIEQRRTVAARPFYLVRPDGERVRVEPDQQALLIAKLDEPQQLSPTWRRRRATLQPGAEVHVAGELTRGPDPQAGGYREGGVGWVLVPPSAGRMVLSAEPLDAPHRRRAGHYRNLALAIVGLLGIGHAAMFLRYDLLRLDGRVVTARVVDETTMQVRGKSLWGPGTTITTHYLVHAAFEDQAGVHPLSDEVSKQFWLRLKGPSAVREVPFVVSRGWPSVHQVGYEPSENGLILALFSILVLVFAGLCAVTLRSTRPWYERKRFVESGAGRL